MPTSRVILLLSGSLRSGSSNETVLRTAQAVAPPQVRTVRPEGGLAGLPHFNPDDDNEALLPAPVAALRAAIDEADAVLSRMTGSRCTAGCWCAVPVRVPAGRRRGGARRRGVGVRRPGAGRVAGCGPQPVAPYFGSRLNTDLDQT
ncbi:NAD(P)H-dependent oxidoreductase [Streptomyces sp. NPDC048411]|uniref:NAD(P)H-dependent oxidoreductase n=1 Tax=Streptomyces sp. NPDC048411 TaxID=3157206 RepID=UPI0034568671